MKKMSKKLSLLALIGTVAAAATAYSFWPPTAKVESAEIEEGVRAKFRAEGSQIEVYADQAWQPYFAKGVNLGATTPGHFPGELAVTKEEYMRWFGMIQEMGANVIRVYTILKPEFYEALVAYNAKRDGDPLFFIQGVWSPEEQLIEGQDAFEPDVKRQFEQEIRDAVGAVYGKAKLEPDPHSGKASGTYIFNAGPYLMGWILGTEWDPKMVDRTNRLHPDVPAYEGVHFRSKPEASPFERWLAEMVDIAAQSEREHGWQHPIAFSNWVTTDPLEHPGEPLFEEDLVSVDPLHVEAVDWGAGYFASYHVYPYYPDFFAFDATYQTMTNDEGEIDSYLAYIHRLKQHHRELPIMITEFGVPASQGVAHTGLLGRDQGGHNEARQGEIDRELFRHIHSEGYSGAILFTWQDEWFKKTWNTLQYDVPDRRAYWYNALTNEAFFGVLGMYPSKAETILIDGDPSDWERLKDGEWKSLEMEAAGFEDIRVSHDEGYLYLLLRLSEPFDPARQTVYIGSDTLPGGNRHAEELRGLTLDEGLETVVELSGEEAGRIRIASNYDFHTRLYRHAGMEPVDPQALRDDSGLFHPWRLVVSYKLEYPDSRFEHPFKDVDVGELIRGTSDPEDPDYDSKAMWQTDGEVVELRIPWMLLGFADPSSLQAINYEDVKNGKLGTSFVDGVLLFPWIADNTTGELIGMPSGSNAEPYPVSTLPLYKWEGWEDVDVKYVERPKQSYYLMQEAMKEVNTPVTEGAP
ncbi:hypothetical protein FE782_08535 [Paenibacillus antri]|uniref:Family 2 glycosyl transferase n=1 Tax=Paenibacillus antri TaxID=2582848 RepID=A0A5R9G8D0_9BACL|nr:hypothetical protein [Paenibacillus antri]TLS52667.1 hypothetical protein FE782_08535 [Paenibacillus antri]